MRRAAAGDEASPGRDSVPRRKFAAEMIKDHKKEIAEYKKMAKRQNDPAAAYAADTLPTLQKHLETAQSLSNGSPRR